MTFVLGRLLKNYRLFNCGRFQSTVSTVSSNGFRNRTNFAQRIWENIMSDSNGTKRIVGHWLIGTSGLVFGIVVLGGLTRLTESGLSMVDWKLLHFRAPGSQEEWQEYFEKYQQFPEYKLNNHGMTLDEFKRIYWFEHAHRVYGRLLGMFVLFPAAFFVAKKWASPGMRRVIMGCTGLVGFQVSSLAKHTDLF
jgi:cytochrome c oxidase assembly protein subunit 15